MTSNLHDLSPVERKALAETALRNARAALMKGERHRARRYAETAAALTPQAEEPWLLLGALASPRASVAYLNQALRIDPSSQRARQGLEWAIRRVKKLEVSSTRSQSPKVKGKQKRAHLPTAYKYAFVYLLLSFLAMAVGISPFSSQILGDLASFVSPAGGVAMRMHLDWLLPISAEAHSNTNLEPINAQQAYQLPLTSLPEETIEIAPPAIEPPSAVAEAAAETQTNSTAFPTDTPTPFPTETPIPTETSFPTDIPTSTPEPTLAPTEITPTLEPTTQPTLQPTRKPKKKAPANSAPTAAGPGVRPPGVNLNDHWIAVNLSEQMTYAMRGDTIQQAFQVSTGRWPTLTVTGVYKIYVKYRTANMSGEDYFLPNVPYVMYFYKGYGLHGTYWHNNFGTPMSHGCVNLRPQDAAWLYEFASVGTLVSVHP